MSNCSITTEAKRPLQNRVTPFGVLIAVPDKGRWMGNRGCLHNDGKQIVRHTCAHQGWIICDLEHKGNDRNPLMKPGQYTELFFLDEATGLSAGHRPCGECRRDAFRSFKSAWLARNQHAGLGPESSIKELDAVLHVERLTDAGAKQRCRAAIGSLPDGVLLCRVEPNANSSRSDERCRHPAQTHQMPHRVFRGPNSQVCAGWSRSVTKGPERRAEKRHYTAIESTPDQGMLARQNYE